MKMKPEHFERLQALCAAAQKKYPSKTLAIYRALGLSAKRYRWDIFWISGMPIAALYEYLNDANIDTALRRIIGEA